MTELEEKLVKAGDAVARSLGHLQTCPKHHPSIPCQCLARFQQSQALSDWEHLMDQIKGA